MFKELEILANLNLNELMRLSVSHNSKELINIVKSQLRDGKNTKGANIHPRYMGEYAAFKKQLSSYKANMGTPDLFLTGSYQNKIDINVNNDSVDYFSSDKKADDLEGRYNSAPLLGIMPENKSKVHFLNDSTLIKKICEKL